MIKVYLGVICVVISTYIGYKISKKYKKRKDFLNSFIEFNNTFKCELSFNMNSIKTISQNLEQTPFIEELTKCITNKEETKIAYLTNDDKTIFNNYVKNIGQSDNKSQIEYVNSVNEKLSRLYQIAKADDEVKSVLAIKLGFLLGLAILILVV